MITLGMDHVASFLDLHQTAKLLVVLSTHCLEGDRNFVWGGSSPQTYMGCTMRPVGVVTVPPQASRNSP